MGELDEAAKLVLWTDPEALVRLAFRGEGEVRVLGTEDVEPPVLRSRMDKVLRIALPGRRARRRLRAHLEVLANWQAAAPRRAHEYWTVGRRAFADLESILLVLKPGRRQGPPTDRYVVVPAPDGRGEPLLVFRFRLVCAWRLEAADLLASGQPGLLTLVPYAAGASPAKVRAAARALKQQVQAGPARADLLAALRIFSENVFPDVHWYRVVPRELLMGSRLLRSVRDEALAEGKAEGLAEGKIEGLAEGEAKGKIEGLRAAVAKLLRMRLGRDARSLVAGLPAQSDERLLLEALERLGGEAARPDLLRSLEALLSPSRLKRPSTRRRARRS